MMQQRIWNLCSSVLAIGLALAVAQSADAATKKRAAQSDIGVCIDPAIEQKLTTCPGGFKMGKFSRTPKAKVGTSTKERKAPKKIEVGPGIGRGFAARVMESAFRKKREKKKIDILKKEITLIRRLLSTTANDDPEKAEILRRLAIAYSEFYGQLNYMARDMDEKIFKAKKKKNTKRAAKLRAQQKILDKKARENRELSIKAFVEIRNNFPDYPEYDLILFSIAYEIDQIANEIQDKKKSAAYRERARIFYQELIRNYPRSRYIPYAWMAFGEFYFHTAKEVDRAMRSYAKVVEWGSKNNPNYVVAMYYQAWCLFNMQEFKRTLNQFNKVIQYAESHPSDKDAKALAKRSRLEMVSPYSKIGNPSQAWEFFQRVGGDLAHQMLVRLADLYYGDGHWADTVIVLKKLQELEIANYLNNNSDDLCHYQAMITNAVISSRPKPEQLTELKRQLALYKRFAKDKHDKVKKKKCAEETIALAWDQATHWHVETKGTDSSPGTKDKKVMGLTTQLYEAILDSFPKIDSINIEGYDKNSKPTRYRVAFYMAELFWEMEDWDNCGKAFDKVVDMNPSGEYTADAANAAVLCYNKVYTAKRGNDQTRKHKIEADVTGDKKCGKACKKCKKKCKGKNKADCLSKCEEGQQKVIQARALTELEKGMLESYERFLCYVTQHEDLVTIKYRRARLYYEANMIAEAAVLFKDIFTNHADDEALGVIAANLYIDCLNILGSQMGERRPGCYEDLGKAVDLTLDTSKAPGKFLMRDEEFANQQKKLKAEVLRLKAEALTDSKQFMLAAETYLQIYREFNEVYNDRGMCEVMFNTAIALEAARLLGPTIKVRRKMIERFPNCEHSKRAALYIGQNYHAMQMFESAAENYVTFAKKYTGEKEAPEALANAAVFYIGLGEYDKAWNVVKSYEKSYKKRRPQDAAKVYFSAGYIYKNQADENDDDKMREKVRKHYTSYLKSYGRVKALHEQVLAHVLVGDTYREAKKKPDHGKALKSYKKALSIFDNKAMDKVANNVDKAKMLNAAAKARFYVAEQKFREFRDIKFPDFKPEKKVPGKIEKWHKKKTPKEELKKMEEWRKNRRRLARWGYYDESMSRREQIKEVKKIEKQEISKVQFEYWLEHNFVPWMEKKAKVLQAATALFSKVAEMHVPEWEMAAAARSGDMQYEFMQALYDAPIDPSMKDDQELVDIYLRAMDEKAKPYRDGAIGGYEYCLNISTKVRWFNSNSIRCEAMLNKLDPRKYPISDEIRIKPVNKLARWAVPDAVLELETIEMKREKALAQSADDISAAEK